MFKLDHLSWHEAKLLTISIPAVGPVLAVFFLPLEPRQFFRPERKTTKNSEDKRIFSIWLVWALFSAAALHHGVGSAVSVSVGVSVAVAVNAATNEGECEKRKFIVTSEWSGDGKLEENSKNKGDPARALASTLAFLHFPFSPLPLHPHTLLSLSFIRPSFFHSFRLFCLVALVEMSRKCRPPQLLPEGKTHKRWYMRKTERGGRMVTVDSVPPTTATWIPCPEQRAQAG